MASMQDPTNVAALKGAIHDHLRQHNVYSRVRSFLADYIRTHETQGMSGDTIVQALKDQGVIDELMQQFQQTRVEGERVHLPLNSTSNALSGGTGAGNSATRLPPNNLAPGQRFLFIELLGGRAFLDNLLASEDGSSAGYLLVSLQLGSQRVRSRVVRAACEPTFDEFFTIKLPATATTADQLLRLSDPVHITCIHISEEGQTTFVGSQELEWRKVLKTNYLSTSVELQGSGTENKIPVGVLDLRLELSPALPRAVPESELNQQLKLETTRRTDDERTFFLYAKAWWKEYLQVRTSHSMRLIKIFAQGEDGANHCVCSFIRPLRAGTLLHSARHAARFVALLAYEREETVGGGRAEIWHTPHTFLTKGRGDVEDHAVLLCSLLLGFGLDAYVCIGTMAETGAHVWVATRAADTNEVTFWESLTGQQYPQHYTGRGKQHKYETLGCVFNHQRFFANNNPDDRVSAAHFNLEHGGQWKAMSPDQLPSPQRRTLAVISPTPVESLPNALEIEGQLKHLVEQHRTREQRLDTVWDSELTHLLGPALHAYEGERVYGVSLGNTEFQQSIKNVVPEGHTFKGFPIQFSHTSVAKMFATMVKSRVCQDILKTRGDQVYFALRVITIPYPERVNATWVMLAVKYRAVAQ